LGFKEELELSVNTAGFGFGVFISNQIATWLSSRKLIDGGGLHFESEADKGSRFYFNVMDENLNNIIDGQQSPYMNIDSKRFVDLRRSEINAGQTRHVRTSQQSQPHLTLHRTFQVSPYVKQ
jgi:hypothetical protein